MATEIKVEIIQRQTVKPSSPTPHHLRNYKLSILDQMALQTYIPILLFYPNAANATRNNVMATSERCQHLMQSFAKTLTHFYPLAGRIKGDAVIECNDDGAEFVESRVKCSLSEIFEHPDAEMLRRFLPVEPESREEAGTGTLLLVQVNLFECGGMAIGLSISHKFGDATTLSTFINCWTAAAHDQSNMLMLPKFGAASLFSPLNFSNSEPLPSVEVDKEKFITRRFVFEASKIAALQSKVTSTVVPKPTRVEAASALIWKCKIEASSRSSSKHVGD
ncbi:hypothetical protein Prudu_281S000400 [Prunus dulcis]|uniref:HXXXD-type acyl-transferase family protein n=1 Tax=Prunus dulcis TaxID=3755 RepID=A0A5H2XLY6_PRUDU|nr:hypothetical protein Prudu_281S000400 [Prunus dulcis]